MSDRISRIIEGVIDREGGFVDNPLDPGGATKYGITERVARRTGFSGPMCDLPRDLAFSIYRQTYVCQPRFDDVGMQSWPIAEEMVDTGVNMGAGDAGKFLQRWLNAFNRDEAFYADIRVDGCVGDKTLASLEAYLERRGAEGEAVMVRGLNCSQGADYLALTEHDDRYETFVYGWLATRVT